MRVTQRTYIIPQFSGNKDTQENFQSNENKKFTELITIIFFLLECVYRRILIFEQPILYRE